MLQRVSQIKDKIEENQQGQVDTEGKVAQEQTALQQVSAPPQSVYVSIHVLQMAEEKDGVFV